MAVPSIRGGIGIIWTSPQAGAQAISAGAIALPEESGHSLLQLFRPIYKRHK